MNMIPFTLKDIAASCGGKYVGPESLASACITGVVRDSRQVSEGNLFLCIKGASVDGHDFAEKAYDSGALCCLVQRPLNTEKPYILVDSVLDAVRYIAAEYRRRLTLPIVGIVGSFGKTTAKEMTASVLSQKFSVLKTDANLNNELGVPLTVLSIKDEHTAAVVEMGISAFGEMEHLAEIVRPDICIMTSIGHCHLEALKDLNGVLKAKSAVFSYMEKNALAVLNGDDDMLRSYDPKIKKVIYGLSDGCDVKALNVKNLGYEGTSCDIDTGDCVFPVHINAYGVHVVSAALAATTVGMALGMDNDGIATGISHYKTVGDRANVIKCDDITIISDCYNASPATVAAGIKSLMSVPGRKVAILGDMLELGDDSKSLHFNTGVNAQKEGIDCLVACGERAKDIYDGFISARPEQKAYYYMHKNDFINDIHRVIQEGDTILVKASHSMRFEDIVEKLKEF